MDGFLYGRIGGRSSLQFADQLIERITQADCLLLCQKRRSSAFGFDFKTHGDELAGKDFDLNPVVAVRPNGDFYNAFF